MSTDPQKTIQEIIDLYLGEEHPDEHTQEQFRAWLAGDGPPEREIRGPGKSVRKRSPVRPAPSRKVLDSYPGNDRRGARRPA